MKTVTVVLAVVALAAASTAAIAQPSDQTERNIATQIVLGNVKASNDSLPGSVRGVVEGRQAASVTVFSDIDRQFVELQTARDKNKPAR